MMEKNPLVTIIIPVYNGSNYIKEAIDSALSQTYKNIEIIVVNDGSKDNGATEKIALSYGDKIRYFYKENGGVSTALNLGIEKMNGEYFSWLSHDDKYTPEKIEKQVELLNNYIGKKVLALCSSRQINKNSDYLEKKHAKAIFEEKKIITWDKVLLKLFSKGTFNGCALLIPKKAFEECGMFDERLRYNQDSFMWLKIFLAGYSLIYRNDCMCMMRVHDGQLTQRGIDIYHKDCERMSEYLIPHLIEKTDEQNRFLYEYAKYNAKYNTPRVWKLCFRIGKGKITFIEKITVRFVALYGKMRPFIRKVYYKLVKKVKTN